MAMIRTSDGRPVRILAIIDEYTRECLSLHVARRIRHQDVLDNLYEVFINRGTPGFIRSDNAPEFTAKAVREWLSHTGVGPLYIEPGSPWENGYVESFIGKSETSCLMGRSLIHYWRPKSLSRTGEGNIISSGLTVPWDTDHRLQRPLNLGF